MKLKSLEVQGFKTFPDRTKLNFTDGITAVVGPNGSGKSNISDAVRWVLGEQSAKTLRCSKMEDVIFNGTQQRKKAGYAQVTLVIDNKDRSLDFDGDEVAVSRRYYRSGSSDYLINGAAVRLQDIHELFMDTGLGRDGYSMIGQGKIDAIVASKSEDRREIFEEAAGISRYRYKKAEAERRLDKTEENLVRLRDIFSEIEGRIEPLRIQAEKAKAYLSYAEEKRSLEISLWLRTLQKSEQTIREQEDKFEIAKAQYSEAELSLERILKESEVTFAQKTECNMQTDTLRREISAAEQEAGAQTTRISVLENDILHNNESIERIKADIEATRQSGRSLLEFIDENQTRLNAKKDLLCKAQVHTDELGAKLSALGDTESGTAQRLLDLNAEFSNLASKQSDAKVLLASTETSLMEIEVRAENLENSIKAKTSQQNTLEGILIDYESMARDCTEKQDSMTMEIGRMETIRDEYTDTAENIKSQQEKLHLDSEQLFRKAKMLEDLEKNLEGFTHSVKAVMKEAQIGRLSGIHGPASRLIKTPKKYSVAIETALGAAVQNIVVQDENSAKAAIAFLKCTNGGRATFLPVEAVRGRILNEKGLNECRGFLGVACDLCTVDEQYGEILRFLLGRIAVTDTLDSAADIAKKYGYRFKVVTLDGQVVNTGGSLTGGSLAKGTGLLGRADEIEQIRRDAHGLAEKADEMDAAMKAELEKARDLNLDIEAMRKELSKVNEDRIKIEAEINSKRAELDNAGRTLLELVNERDTDKCRREELEKLKEEAQKQLDDCAAAMQKNENEIDLLTGNRENLAKKRSDLQEKLQSEKMELLALQKDIESIQSDIDGYNMRIKDDSGREERLLSELEDTAAKTAELKSQIEDLRKNVAEQTRKAEDGKKQLEELSTRYKELEAVSSRLRDEERDKTVERENLGGELARVEERKNNLQKEYDGIVSKLWEEYELTKREAEQIAVKVEDTGSAQRKLSELKQKIRDLGNVNVSAVEEYKNVSERYEFLKEQIEDIEKSKTELSKLIQDLTKQMREIFICRFREIGSNFSKTFTDLFGGGNASLELSDPENVLTSGIEIKVEPPGKIVSHLELLSGGEKALVAIALYFAIMKVSPAPFCVMDEIEAALDDVNVDRFASYLRRMNDKTQFICITHRRGTMEEADVLYGVTMQDRGISKLLELRAAEIEQKLGIKV